VWLGSLVFFAFVVAPVAFSSMVTSQTHNLVVSGTIVGAALRALHWIGLGCGVVFAICVLQLRRRWMRAQLGIIAAMLALTALSQFWIIPRMDRDRVEAGGDIDAASLDSPARQDFERLHPLSEKVEGGVMLGGLALVFLMASEASFRAHTIE
jgi:hypothetical protein